MAFTLPVILATNGAYANQTNHPGGIRIDADRRDLGNTRCGSDAPGRNEFFGEIQPAKPVGSWHFRGVFRGLRHRRGLRIVGFLKKEMRPAITRRAAGFSNPPHRESDVPLTKSGVHTDSWDR
jgi:hypothetical protein